MKTSKIIFISLLGTIALIILAFVIDVRITGRKNGDNVADFNSSKLILPSFKVLNLSSCKYIQIIHNDSSFMEINYPKDSIVPNNIYTIAKDTLTISGRNKKNHLLIIKIHTTDSLKNIKLENSYLTISDFYFSRMSFDLNHSRLYLNLENKDKSSAQAIHIIAKNHSDINCYKFNIDSLEIILHNSEADFMTHIDKINGSITDTSKIVLRQVEGISLKKDVTSKINIYN